MSDPLRVGLIGCGAIARRSHVPGLQAAGAVLTAFASRSPASAALAASEAGTGEVVEHWEELVARPDVDAVVVCTPNTHHAPQAVAALEAGKHVLVEKPFAVSVTAADAVLASAAAHGLVAMVAHNLRFAPPAVAARDAVRQGVVGTVTAVRGVFCHGGPLVWAPEAAWFLDRSLAGGGALLDLGVHLVDTTRFVLDDDFASVAATLALGTHGLEEDGLLLFDTRKGVVGSLHAGWRSQTGLDFSLTVVGDKGSVVVTASGAVVHGPDGQQALSLAPDPASVQEAFVRAVAAGRAEPPDGHDGRAAVAVVEAAYESSRTGRTVRPA
jgi:predicted dehydrogenase